MAEVSYIINMICRSCKNESTNRICVFELADFCHPSVTIAQILLECTQVQIAADDGLPSNICHQCLLQLKNSYIFKKQCETTDQELRLNLKNVNCVKQEQVTNAQFETLEVDENGDQFGDESLQQYAIKKEYACNKCSRRFLSADKLQLHENNHNLGLTKKCDYCNREFAKSSHLERHHRLHVTNDTTYMCKLCNKTYKKIKAIRRHTLTHSKIKPYNCNKCNRRFARTDHLTKHTTKCKGDGVYGCGFCNRAFHREDYLKVHLARHKSKSPATLQESDDLNRYITLVNVKTENIPDDDDDSESNGEDFEATVVDDCNISNNRNSKNNTPDLVANFEFELKVEDDGIVNVANLDNLSVQNDPEFIENFTSPVSICTVCEKQFTNVVTRDIHMSKHNNHEITCSQCDEKYRQRRQFKRHVAKVHSSNDGNQADNISNTDSVENKLKTVDICKICSKRFTESKFLNNHMLRVHDLSNENNVDKVETGANVGDKNSAPTKLDGFACRCCKKKLLTLKHRRQHEKMYHKKKKGMHECKTCAKMFNTKMELQEHIKYQFECAKKYLCSECGQRFIRNDYLVVHMRRHRGEKPYKCKYCDKGFPRTTDLTVHERYHTGEKTHLCTICGRGFGRAYNLTVHMRTHTGERPYQCTYCNASFAQGNDLKTHVRRHTGERYQCDLCSATFIMAYMLTQHQRSVHGLNVRSHIRRLKPSERLYAANEKNARKKLANETLKSANNTIVDEANSDVNSALIVTPKLIASASPVSVLKKKRQRDGSRGVICADLFAGKSLVQNLGLSNSLGKVTTDYPFLDGPLLQDAKNGYDIDEIKVEDTIIG